MTDPLAPEQRSALMARVKQRDTKPELFVRRQLHARGWRYRVNVRGIPGTPDIVFAKLGAVVFIHGCFWHGHNCRLCKLPKTRSDFWADKLSQNRLRDERKRDHLMSDGWRVLTVWQCELLDAGLIERIELFLGETAKVAVENI